MLRKQYINEAKLMKGQEVEVAGWVHKFVDMGKLKFIILRDRTGQIQITAKKGIVPEELLTRIKANREYVVRVKGKVTESKMAPEGVEVIPSDYEILNSVDDKLPVDPTDEVPAELETRLEYRYLDLRRKKVNAIFEMKSILINTFRSTLFGMGFTEIHPPSIIAAASEGGTDVFEMKYFENKAYLVQSPQLYKQMAVIGGLDKVFITTPVFRAEKHNTTTHLNEVLQMDIEMGFADHHDAMDVLEVVFLAMLRTAASRKDLLSACDSSVSVPQKVKRLTYTEVVEMLQKAGEKIEWGHDFTREHERKIFELLKEEALFIYEYPTAIRAFYSMPSEKDEKICNAFDLMYRGLEISSGAQRIHKIDILEKQLKSRGLNPADFEFYAKAFRFGAPPHAGWSIGLERLAMKVCGQENIREAALFPRDRTRLTP
ncbi:MAG: aspartate--tRNA(Asn) ligase [Candidatus ainarchaeum sp.]|nr:aspartate--tRNA(Asn) ligase [Candidatus ainarchaeum sp.]